MSKYIDADAALSRLPDDLPYKASVKRVIMQAPTADVEAVRHGVWLHTPRTVEGKIFHRWQCSVCARTVATVKRNGIADYPYCHCGSKMGGERETDDEG